MWWRLIDLYLVSTANYIFVNWSNLLYKIYDSLFPRFDIIRVQHVHRTYHPHIYILLISRKKTATQLHLEFRMPVEPYPSQCVCSPLFRMYLFMHEEAVPNICFHKTSLPRIATKSRSLSKLTTTSITEENVYFVIAQMYLWSHQAGNSIFNV